MTRQSRPRTTTLGLLLVAATGPVLYPLWLARKTRGLRGPEPPEPEEWPGVSVIIPAYRERAVIGQKVRNVLENGYPGPLEVIVVSDDPGTSAAARSTAAHVVDGHERAGKANALNLGVRKATQPVAVFTDANAMLEPDGLRKLVRWLDDPEIGAVTGEKRIRGGSGEGMYWAFESWLKQREFLLGTTIGVCGELVAVRREEYTPLPVDVAVDDLWLALDVSDQGRRIAYEPSASVEESASGSVEIEWERRTRVVSGALDALWRRRDHLMPGNGVVAKQLWGHRLVRSSLGPVAHAALLARALGAVHHSLVARLFVALHVVGGRSLWREGRGETLRQPERTLAHVLFLQAVGLGGTLRWLRGDRPAVWRKEERSSEDDLEGRNSP